MEHTTAEGSAPADAERPLVRTRLDGAVAVVMLDSPSNRNALSIPVMAALVEALATAAADDEVRVIVIVAEGPAFCSGADLKELASPDGDGPHRSAAGLLALLRAIVTLPKPVIARVHGATRASGLGLVGAADLAIAGNSATFGFTEARLGLAAAVVSLTTLPRMVPRAASRALLTGATIDAQIAEEIGLISQVVPDESLDVAVDVAVGSLLAASPQGLAATKELLTRQIRAQMAGEGPGMVELSAGLFASPEGREGMAAFLAHRPPSWALPDR
jgi:enoyl-CoA hydratase